eukprot:1052841-Pyramimonas_sp.AAC.1
MREEGQPSCAITGWQHGVGVLTTVTTSMLVRVAGRSAPVGSAKMATWLRGGAKEKRNLGMMGSEEG